MIVVINGKRTDLTRDERYSWSQVYKGPEVVGEPLIIFENLGMVVTVDDDDNVFVRNKQSGVVVKLAESGGAIAAEKLAGTPQSVRFL